MVTELVGPGLMLYLVSYHKKFLVRWYDPLTISVQVVIAFAIGQRPAVIGRNGYHSPVFVLARHFPLVPMLFYPIFFPTTFWAQLGGQTLGVVTSLVWARTVCDNTILSTRLHKGMNTVMWYLQAWLSTIFVINPGGSNDGYSCVIASGFAHYALLFVIPCALKYVLESQTRATYLTSKLSFSARTSITAVLWENIRFCGLVSALSLVSILLVMPTS